MKRLHMNKKVNRNNNTFKHQNRTTVSPEILVGQIWLQDEPAAVEIIELNTSDELEPTNHGNAQHKNNEHAWSYANSNARVQDNYKINTKARERRRNNKMNRENLFFSKNTSTSSNRNDLYPETERNPDDDNNFINHQVNCFTIINKHFVNSDTSSEDELADVEIITSNNATEPIHNNWGTRQNYFDDEIITYDPDLDNDTRTIWIYSFKNKHLLDNDLEFSQMLAKESSSYSTSGSPESDEGETNDTKGISGHRLGSPIPTSYMPRLNLAAPTLSTVTEVSEPKQPSPNGSYKSLQKNKILKANNGWFKNDAKKLACVKSVPTLEKSTNVMHWMALSPRDECRKLKHTFSNGDGIFIDAIQRDEKVEVSECQTKLSPDTGLRVQVDVHVSVSDKTPRNKSSGAPNSADAKVQASDDVNTSLKENIKHVEMIEYKEYAQDRGDHDMNLEGIPRVLYLPNAMVDRAVGNDDSLDKQTNNQFEKNLSECESKDEKGTPRVRYLPRSRDTYLDARESIVDQMWMKNNVPFLKPSLWHEYLPIAESTFSLHLSLGSIIEERQSWFKRFMKYFNCCR